MSQAAAPVPVNNIIIVKRGGGEEEGHHGGAWKIAFADFMTAMMAFFLVMWLSNVTDEATKKQVAQYFNPIKLNSASPEAVGLDNGETPATMKVPPPVPGEIKDGGSTEAKPLSGSATGGQEQALFRDPYAILAEIAAEGGPGVQKDGTTGTPNGTGLPGLNGGEAYRDPFDPNSWQLQPNVVPNPEKEKAAPAELQTKTEVTPAPAAVNTPIPTPAPPKDAPQPADGKMSPKAETLKAEIQKQLKSDGAIASGVEVSEGEGGITISLADNLTTGMFEIGSAKPKADTVHMMEKIAKILSERKGQVVIRGYTDARPYSGEEYDNWRLSTSRAHMAYYMLTRGGLVEDRVQSIEGFGDRELKDPKDPFSAVNRRIEILLKEPGA